MRSLALPRRWAIGALLVGTGFAIAGWLWGPRDVAFAGLLLAYSLAWVSAIDIRDHVLPNAITIGLILVGLCVSVIRQPAMLADCLAGAFLGYVLIFGIGLWFTASRGQRGIGMGDAKLLAAAGAWVGAQALPAVILVSTAMGIAFLLGKGFLQKRLDRHTKLPFGPFIAFALWLSWTIVRN